MSNEAYKQYRFWSRYTKQSFEDPQIRVTTFSLFAPLVLLIVIGLIVYPQIKSIVEMHKNLSEKNESFRQTQEDLKRLADLKENYVTHEEGVNRINEIIPTDVKLADFLEDLSNIANVHGFQLSNFTPRTIKENSNNSQLKEQKITAKIRGDLSNTLEFVKDLEDYKRFVVVEGISISNKSEGDGEGVLEITVFSLK